MVNMKTAKCTTCGGVVLKLAGSLSKICHDECTTCRSIREEEEALEQQNLQAEADEQERRALEETEMERHFERHPQA